MDRRRFLAALGAVGVTATAGCSRLFDEETPSETPTPPPPTGTGPPTGTEPPTDAEPPTATGERFETRVDAVADAGCDPSGSEPCDEAFDAALGDDTLLSFPPGEYLMTRTHYVEHLRNFGMVGTGPDRSAVRFVHPTGFAGVFLNVRDGRNCLFRNFTAVQTGDRRTNSGFVLLNRDGLLVEDVEVAGFTPTEGGTNDMIVRVSDPDGVGVVRRFVTAGGSEVGIYPRGHVGLFSGPGHRGTLRLEDCRIEECANNGVYASRTVGPVQVEGGVYRNNNVSQVRVCGEGSYVEDATIVVDTDAADEVVGTHDNVRGIWWESGWQGKTGGHVAGCDLVARSTSLTPALLQIDGTAGGLAVRDCSFEVDTPESRAVLAHRPGSSGMGGTPPRPWDVTVEGIDVSGTARGTAAIQVVGRGGSVVRDVTVRQTGRERGGIFLHGTPGTEVADSSVVTTQFPVVVTVDGDPPDDRCVAVLRSNRRLESTGVRGGGEITTTQSGDGRAHCITPENFDGSANTVAITGTDRDGLVGRVTRTRE